MDTLTVLAPINDGIGTFEASFCAGLPSTFDLGGFGYQQASGAPVALSRSEAVVPLDGYRVTGFECPITRNDRNALRVELGQLGGLGTSRFEFHIENAVMAKAPLAAIDLQQVLGRLSPNSIIGPACVANDCQRRGFTSQGNNRICDNGINGPASDCGAIAVRQAKFGNMQVQMNFNGQDNSASDNFVCAQNNCWGATPVSPPAASTPTWPAYGWCCGRRSRARPTGRCKHQCCHRKRRGSSRPGSSSFPYSRRSAG